MNNNKTTNNNKSITRGPARRIFALILAIAFAAVSLAVTEIACAYEDTPDASEAALQEQQKRGVEAGAYEVTGYTLRATVNKDHSYDVEERIDVNIPDKLRSIEFAVPNGNFRISDITVDNKAYKTRKTRSTGKVSIKDADKLSAGVHEYTISYRIEEYQDGDRSRDIFYYNALLPEWKQPIGKVDIEVSFPQDFPFDDMQCYAGQFGVQDSTNKITFKKKANDKTVKVTGNLIPENYGITLKAQLPEGYWTGALSGKLAFISILMSMAVVLLILTALWFIGGRDPKIKKQKRTKPMEGYSPVELGYVYNGHVSIKDVVRMLLEFAMKGYLRISEFEPKRYRVYREEDPSEEEKMYRTAYNILFEDVFKDRAIEMDELIQRLRLIKRSISDDVAAGFASPGSSPFTQISRVFRYVGAAVLGTGLAFANALSYVYAHQPVNYVESALMGIIAGAAAMLLCQAVDTRDSSSDKAGNIYVAVALLIEAAPIIYVAVVITKNTRDPIPALAVFIATGIALFLIIIMRARGRENAEMITDLRQLRHFIYHPTPKELLENHLADDNYYYEMLLYALAYGAEESWAISFLTLDVKEPDWFTNDIEGEAFSNLKLKKETVDYARDIKSFVRTVENAYSDMIRHNSKY